MIKKISKGFLEKGFQYPESYNKIIELNLVDFDYWYVMNEEQALKRLTGLRDDILSDI
ncbi:hypothetical protein [Priestia koreensis]|uniref:hypothetical protein n=1 Tax=Priestia koreensis TaxID=284581 RepID=UPI003459A5FA